MKAEEYKKLVKKKRRITSRPEQALQIQCVQWFRLQYPNILIHHSPNGGKRSYVEAAIFKAMGTLAGWPDLFIAYKSNGFGGLFIEMKSKDGRPSKSQKDIGLLLFNSGYCYLLAAQAACAVPA